MTVIAYRDGILAADTLVTTSGGTRIAYKPKIERVKNGWLIGASGCPGALVPIRRWVAEGCKLDQPVVFDKVEDSTGILISPKGEIFHTDTSSCYVQLNHAEFTARGSGTDAALGAMIAGADAVQAVRAAIQVDIGCGGEPTWLSVDKTSDNLEFKKEIYTLVNLRV